ncbi:unnamed protein product [Caenorhabditis auriculariae]|uniref:Uncharacterized protein n=1 Tax=Caenorhabditis auriculariae TaxID=2777116 RepID=A0A8S1HA37_9PELO|nr:unnamed protein product [Caenorhabditis auriculariae]
MRPTSMLTQNQPPPPPPKPTGNWRFIRPLNGNHPVGWQQAVRHLSRVADPMSLVQANAAQFEAFQNLPPVDLQGGTLLDVQEDEEVDPNDGCRVQVITYRILSADQTEELTKIFRRKIKIDCTQTMRRLEVSNGREAKIPRKKCERVRGDIKGMKPVEVVTNNSQMLELDPNNAQDVAISNALRQVPDTFFNILSKEKDMFVKMYPDLFEKMRSESSLIPSTTTEVITNPDGSTTTRMRSSKSYSSHFSRQETFINGVKQMSKSKFRAFVEYRGPEGGFHVKLTDHDDDELSEDEEDDKTSRTLSEITDESEIISTGPAVKKEVQKRHEKAWFAAKELVDSEQRYVEKLKLLGETFRLRILKEKDLMNGDKQAKLFANVASLYQFHNTHFLPQMMDAIREWQTTKRLSHVVRKQAPFLKMYSEYTNNYDRASKLFEELRKKKKFNDVVKEIEKQPECDGLPLSHHLICPVQRVMRYQLLLQEYKKHLEETDVDYEDTAVALELVLQAAAHANQMMKRLEGFSKLVEVQEQLGNSISLVSPGRELIKSGPIQKISSTTEKAEERFIFLFNDMLILASERKMIGMAKYKLRAVFNAASMQIGEGDNLEREHSFYVRGSSGNSAVRRVELFTESQKEKSDWVDSIFSIIDDACAGTSSVRSSVSEYNNNGCSESRNCSECDFEFSLWSRGVKCSKCKRKMCKKCFGRYRTESKRSRVCESCTKSATSDGLRRCVSTQSNARSNLLYKPAAGKGVLHASRIKFRGTLGKVFDRYMVVRNDFCLYSYNTPEDECALAMLPLPGCEVKICGEKYTFSVRVGARRMYTMTAEDEQCQARWMAVLDLAANAQLNGNVS